MQEPSGRTFGLWLGLCTVAIGFFFMGIGLAAEIVGRRSDGFTPTIRSPNDLSSSNAASTE